MKRMINDEDLHQIRERLNYLGSAVMYNLSGHPESLPNNLARFLCMDSKGRLWFSVKPSRPFQSPPSLSFPAHFCLYRKDAGFYATAEGTASIVEEGHGCPECLLIRFGPQSLEFIEYRISSWSSPFQKFWTRVSNFFYPAERGRRSRPAHWQIALPKSNA